MNNLESYINNEIKALSTTNKVFDAVEIFEDLPFSHVPILEDGVYIGCIGRENAFLLDENLLLEASKFHLERFFVRSTMIWLEVLGVFSKYETTILPVLDAKNNYLGYYELEDLIHFLQDTPFLKEDGGLLVVSREVMAFSMSQVVQIVESNNAKLLGVFISSFLNNRVEITLKISESSINDIIQTFRRYEYEIISEHQDDSYLNSLKERSDYLDKYLNI